MYVKKIRIYIKKVDKTWQNWKPSKFSPIDLAHNSDKRGTKPGGTVPGWNRWIRWAIKKTYGYLQYSHKLIVFYVIFQ